MCVVFDIFDLVKLCGASLKVYYPIFGVQQVCSDIPAVRGMASPI